MFLFRGLMQVVLGIFLFVVTSMTGWCGTNPIGFSVSPSGGLPATTRVGSSYSVMYTLTNNLPFNQVIKRVSRSFEGIGFTATDACSGKTLTANGGTCTFHVVFRPTRAENARMQLTMYYNRDSVPLPAVTTKVVSGATTDISGAVTHALPADTTVSTGYTVEFTFTNIGTTNVTASSITYTGDTADFSVTSTDCASQITPTNHCNIIGTFTPSSAGEKTIGATYNYSAGTKSVAVSTHTLASGGSGGCASVSGQTALLLPTSTYQYADNLVKFRFTNNCDSASATLGTVSITGTYNDSSLKAGINDKASQGKNNAAKQNLAALPATNWITMGSGVNDTCSGQTIAAGDHCDVIASVIPKATGSNLMVEASVSYNQSSQTKTATASTTAASILANDTKKRMVTFVNQCSVPVWMTFVAAAVPAPNTCSTTSDCPTGSTCNSGICYFNNPSLDGNHPYGQLSAAVANQAPDTMNVSISLNNAGTTPKSNILYNGGVAGRLGCTTTGDPKNPLFCTVNNCGGTVTPLDYSTQTDGQCQPGTGPLNYPAMTFNEAELTFLKAYSSGVTDGVYDVQTINGVSIPIEIKGRGPDSAGTAPYNNCPPAGGVIQKTTGSTSTQLGFCSYDYTPPTVPSGARASNYKFVQYVTGASHCDTSDSECTATGEVCGITYDTDNSKIARRCGQLAGYISVNTGICAQTAAFEGSLGTDLKALYNCSTNYTYSTGAQLYACSGTYAGQSCYNPLAGNPTASCCGCVDWWTSLGGSQTVPTSTQACGIYVNPDWADPDGIVQKQIQWVKSACPTAYSYQYDDPSSSFHCTVTDSDNTSITTNYQITFCPGGKQLSYITP